MARNGTRSRYLAYRRRRRRHNGNGTPRWVLALVLLGGVFGIVLAILAGVAYGVYQSYANDLVPPDEAIAKLPRGGARILDRNGKLLYQFVDDVSGVSEPVSSDEMSLYLVLATIATEDASFLDNPGVNFEGLSRAALDNFWPFGGTPGFLEGRGGSSITQQLVKNVYFSPEERAERSVKRKIKETVLALELTKQYSKQQILTWYLNLISYGNIYNGVEAASQGYFGKHAKDLTLAESATLAAIPSCPSCYDPLNRPEATVAQRNYVLTRMYDEGYVSAGQLWEAASQPLDIKPQRFPVNAPHFVFNVVQPELERLFGEQALRRDGLIVHTTLDLDWQVRAEKTLEEWITTFESSGGHNGAAVGIDPTTGEYLFYVGSRDYFRDDILGRNDMADAVNSPGSAFKPITYVTAFMTLGWGPGITILDTPIQAKYWDGDKPPRNPGTGFRGPITVRNALGNSLNIPAIKTIIYTGVDNVITQAKKMGITSLDGRQLGPSMTVGGVDVKLNDMVYAFTAYPNLGVLKGVPSTVDRPPGNRELDPVAILRVEDRDGNVLYPKVDGNPVDRPPVQEVRVAPPEETYLVADILSDPSAQCIVFGCGGLSIGRPMGVKTGTSEPYADSFAIGDTWAIAFTPQLVVGSWFGNADNSPMTGITSTSVSWRTVRDIMVEYHNDKPVVPFTRPEGLVKASVCIPSWLKLTASCPKGTPEDLLAARSLPQRDDDWWALARIDKRTGKLASELTPEAFVEERRFLQLPPGLPDFVRDEALAWAVLLGAGGAGGVPTEQTQESDIPAAINSPLNGDQISGVVTVSGRASSAEFVSYRLEIQGDDQSGPELLMESTTPVADGVLGNWDTSGLPDGVYTLTLVVTDAALGDVSYRVQVLLVNESAPDEPAAPVSTDVPGDTGGGRGRGRGHDDD